MQIGKILHKKRSEKCHPAVILIPVTVRHTVHIQARGAVPGAILRRAVPTVLPPIALPTGRAGLLTEEAVLLQEAHTEGHSR